MNEIHARALQFDRIPCIQQCSPILSGKLYLRTRIFSYVSLAAELFHEVVVVPTCAHFNLKAFHYLRVRTFQNWTLFQENAQINRTGEENIWKSPSETKRFLLTVATGPTTVIAVQFTTKYQEDRAALGTRGEIEKLMMRSLTQQNV